MCVRELFPLVWQESRSEVSRFRTGKKKGVLACAMANWKRTQYQKGHFVLVRGRFVVAEMPCGPFLVTIC